MGKLSKKLKKGSLLFCAIINAVLPVLLLSGIGIPLGVVVGCNIISSICMVIFTRADDVESIIVNDGESMTTSTNEPTTISP
jgi:hypothetical protein